MIKGMNFKKEKNKRVRGWRAMGMPTDWVVMEDLTYATVVQADASWILGHTDGWKSCDS